MNFLLFVGFLLIVSIYLNRVTKKKRLAREKAERIKNDELEYEKIIPAPDRLEDIFGVVCDMRCDIRAIAESVRNRGNNSRE